MSRRFKTCEEAVLHIQRAFRHRRQHNLNKAAKTAMMTHGENMKKMYNKA